VPGMSAMGPDADPRWMLQATVEALSTMDVEALRSLCALAEEMELRRAKVSRESAVEALMMKQALGELLRSTERSLRMLRGIHEARVRRVEEEAWAH
jgi:hypothetical protein